MNRAAARGRWHGGRQPAPSSDCPRAGLATMTDTSDDLPYTGPDDAEFQHHLELARAGDPAGWAALYRGHHGALLAFLRSQMPQEVDDLASEAWISATRTIHGFTGDERAFRSWLVTIGRRRFIDRLRARQRHRVHTDIEAAEGRPDASATDPAKSAVDRDQFRRVTALLDQLTMDEAEVVRLRVVAGMGTEQVAEQMGRTTNSVRVLQHRALRKLAGLVQAQAAAGNGGASGSMDQVT